MKKITQITFTVMALLAGAFGANAQNVGIGTSTPNVSARLDISATNKGLLIPQVSLVSLTDVATVATPATGLLVYNTNATLGTGFYYNSGTPVIATWQRLQTSGGSSGWSLVGNAGTDSTLNFLGTTNAKPLMFRVNNGYAGIIGTQGGLAFGRGANGTSRITSPGVIAIGDSALFSNLDSSEVAIGNQALFSNTTGFQNTAIGEAALISNSIGFQNVAVGNQALVFNDTAFSNVAVGFGAGFGTVTEQNTAVGALALANDFEGFSNTALGYATLNSNVFGFYNVAVGELALLNNTNGNRNTIVGRASFANDTTGERNTSLGYFSGINVSSGNRNIAIGSYAMRTNATGSNNICIGDSANTSTAALNNAIAIGNSSIVNASNRVVVGNVAHTSIGGQVGWTTFSDGRYKKDVEENVSGLSFIMQLRPVTYHYDFSKINSELYGNTGSATVINKNFGNNVSKKGGKMGNINMPSRFSSNLSFTDNTARGRASNGGSTITNLNEGVRFTGFIAQEVEAAAKKVGYDFSGVDKPAEATANYGLRYAEFVVPLVKAVQEQQAVIDAQNKKIDELIKRLEKLENK